MEERIVYKCIGHLFFEDGTDYENTFMAFTLEEMEQKKNDVMDHERIHRDHVKDEDDKFILTKVKKIKFYPVEKRTTVQIKKAETKINH